MESRAAWSCEALFRGLLFIIGICACKPRASHLRPVSATACVLRSCTCLRNEVEHRIDLARARAITHDWSSDDVGSPSLSEFSKTACKDDQVSNQNRINDRVRECLSGRRSTLLLP